MHAVSFGWAIPCSPAAATPGQGRLLRVSAGSSGAHILGLHGRAVMARSGQFGDRLSAESPVGAIPYARYSAASGQRNGSRAARPTRFRYRTTTR